MCFEILGFDILLDSDFNPFLLEVNHSPSFEISSPLDKKIKTTVIKDALMILNLNTYDKEIFEYKNKNDILQRSVYRKSFQDRIKNFGLEKNNLHAERDDFEERNSGGFVKIFPKYEEYYNLMITSAKNI